MTTLPSPCIFGCEHVVDKPRRLSSASLRCAGHDEAAALQELQAVLIEAGSRCLTAGCHQAAAGARRLASAVAADAHVWDLKAAVCEQLPTGPLQDAAARMVESWTGSFEELRTAAQALHRSRLSAVS